MLENPGEPRPLLPPAADVHGYGEISILIGFMGIAVRDRMFLGMQDFDFVQTELNLTQILPNLLNFYPIYPNLPKFARLYPNFPKLFPNWPKFFRNLPKNIC